MLNTCKSNGFWQSIVGISGRRVSNAWTTSLQDWDNPPKGELIPYKITIRLIIEMRLKLFERKVLEERSMSYQLVGEVMAHQSYDG